MSHLTVRREIAAPAGVVWDVVGRFDGDQEPLGGLVRTRIEGGGIGSLRTTEFAGGDVLLERLEFLDDRRRSYRSQLVRAGSLPVMDCRISAHVEELPVGLAAGRLLQEGGD